MGSAIGQTPAQDLKRFHAPVLYIVGGSTDIAYDNAMDDFSRLDRVPVAIANLDVGHTGTYARPHGGEFTRVALAWLDWQFRDRKELSKTFLGADSELNRDADWTLETKNFDSPGESPTRPWALHNGSLSESDALLDMEIDSAGHHPSQDEREHTVQVVPACLAVLNQPR